MLALPYDVEVGRRGVPTGKRLAGKAAADRIGPGRRRDGIEFEGECEDGTTV